MVFDYIYINDLVKIVEYFIINEAKYKFFNVGRGLSIDIKTIAHIIIKFFSNIMPINIVNKDLSNEYTCDTTRLQKNIKGLEYTDFSVSIKEMITYYQSIIPVLKKSIYLNK